jgi:hypothetical protein
MVKLSLLVIEPTQTKGMEMANYLTGSQRYNNKLNKIFDEPIKRMKEEEKKRLEVAAPELLEALKACYRALSIDSDMEEDFAPEIKQAKQAITKAEGK